MLDNSSAGEKRQSALDVESSQVERRVEAVIEAAAVDLQMVLAGSVDATWPAWAAAAFASWLAAVAAAAGWDEEFPEWFSSLAHF